MENENQSIAKPLRIFGAVTAVINVVNLVALGLLVFRFVHSLLHGTFTLNAPVQRAVLIGLAFVLFLALIAMITVLGIRLVRNKRRGAAVLSYATLAVLGGIMLCDIMLDGFTLWLLSYAIIAVLLIALATYLDPALIQERRVQTRLRELEDRDAAQAGTLGRDPSGKGYIALNFFNVFWIFVVACIAGLVFETIYHIIVYGAYQDRTGMLYGPFSPIYGVGALLMTMALNRFHDKPLIVIFVVSAVIGGAFEYVASLFFEYAFGITAWDYTGYPGDIGGRTCLPFMAAWGMLGIVWIRLMLPSVLKLINRIPWNWRYALTSVCAILMVFDIGMTLLSFDCWFERLADVNQDTAVATFFAEHYDNTFMAEHFQSMNIDPSAATRS